MRKTISRDNIHKGRVIVIVTYVSFLLFTYPLDRFLPSLRFSDIVYFNPFRVAILIALFTVIKTP